MNCWHCERPAQGGCAFCGRGICKDHVQELPNILSTYRGEDGVHRAIVVADALYCGVCRPNDEPVPLEGLK